ncbi:3'-5' exonuclease (macronuclear) [Tetrahymena thermophila SB210]|uniref:3'-5' exonuclease n=1 Tax=Tetrahymena thermophila (strain SB210) TaxID=312017 RepID=Q24FV9_TETTS|nr:3'-5' exonuclease [Tetrahymena thermophila SB210]EAS06651.2 3'-5' exonuclease [Tetrahymena thermophila SB210]|eukprot:XP_001026896.2 3'-5' exonuclease [Tetrahymena thermophila SB210]
MAETNQDQQMETKIEEQKQNQDKKKTKYQKKNKKNTHQEEQKQNNSEQQDEQEDNNQGFKIYPHKVDHKFISQVDFAQFDKLFNSDIEKDQQEAVLYLKAFVKEKKPTLINFFDIFDHYFKKEENKGLLEKSVLKMFTILKCLSSLQANSIIYKSFFCVIQHNSVKIPDQDKQYMEEITQAWKYVHTDSLSTFLTIFDITNQIKKKDVSQEVKDLIVLQKYQEAVKIISVFSNYTSELAPQLIHSLTNNKDASKAADMIKQFKLNPNNFPEVEIRLKKMSMRYNLRTYSWEFVAELFREQKDILAYAVEDLLYNKQYNEAYSILKSDEQIIKYVHKKESLEALNDPSIKFEVLPNKLYTMDYFSPQSENIGLEPEGTHLNLSKDFGITRDKVFFINNVKSQDFEFAKKELESAKQIGLDGEFRPAVTKLDNNSQSLALLQLATQNYCFLFDPMALKNEKEYELLQQNIFQNPNILKIGHTISGDISMVASQLNGQLNFKGSLDLAKLHKVKNPEQKQSSLSFIAKFQLGKALCKGEQTSNWSQRPLREAQIHYGALDAYISIALYNKYIELYGEKDLNQFVERI